VASSAVTKVAIISCGYVPLPWSSFKYQVSVRTFCAMVEDEVGSTFILMVFGPMFLRKSLHSSMRVVLALDVTSQSV
jgi:hypothetical protein